MKRLLFHVLLFAAGFAVGFGANTALAAESDITVTASGLDKFEGELIEIGYTDPRTDAGFEVLGIAIIQDGEATMRIPLSEPLLIELNLLAGAKADEFRVRGIAEPGGDHEVLWDSAHRRAHFQRRRLQRDNPRRAGRTRRSGHRIPACYLS